VDRGDVRVAERRQQLRFPPEACEPLGIGGDRLRQELERDVAPEPRVLRAPDLAHAAGLAALPGGTLLLRAPVRRPDCASCRPVILDEIRYGILAC
jgi:hypothetical protein